MSVTVNSQPAQSEQHVQIAQVRENTNAIFKGDSLPNTRGVSCRRVPARGG